MTRKKLVLDPERLRVESFDTVDRGGGRGTVHGHGYTDPDYPSCARTCGASPPPDTALCLDRSGTCPQQCCL